ncbi:aminotransferase class I/II-fold pyridoxal phosphate-dependent enzyme [Butyricicoccus faecihominis]|uniref:pyridoxal phosphate-dependent aminotransferase n=1 Tax=Butyricicoccus faecihominis TaxID=1712515 RepID=UPI002479B02E|nr:aminotransferase class I/II-fold pyridoxal phosphate-dependent enzyme [Butyricicoccus faecihominis]MCQ5129139.1 aminotransferase class I/II-fold pyridoxal phosphate-dependent enzyme [Butyricicoccus faecihominis]
MVDYQQLLSDRVKIVKPSGIRKFFDVAAAMPHAISLGVGEPDFETPWQIRRAGIQSLEKGRTFYTSNWGLAELRDQIAALARRKYQLCYDSAKEVLVTVGGSEAIDNALRAFISLGDEVLIPEPSFVCYTPLTIMAGGVPVPLPTVKEDQFKLTPERLKAAITPKTKVLILPYPNNPTGAIMTRDELAAIAKVLEDTNILVISDEIYCSLTYGAEPHVCFAELPGMKERTIVVDGFSKSYAMTGWRLGWAMGPKELMQPICKIHQFGIMSAPTTAQFAGIEAIRTGEDDVQHMREQYDIRRRFLLGELRDMGLSCFEPQGAFYMFPSIESTGLSSEEFCERLLHEQEVAVVPGNAFGDSGEGHVRISYSYSMNHLREACSRIRTFLKTL